MFAVALGGFDLRNDLILSARVVCGQKRTQSSTLVDAPPFSPKLSRKTTLSVIIQKGDRFGNKSGTNRSPRGDELKLLVATVPLLLELQHLRCPRESMLHLWHRIARLHRRFC